MQTEAGFATYATVMRYCTGAGDRGKRQRHQVLVVTKLGPVGGGEACHAAYVDAVANSDANALAKMAADAVASGFDCHKEPVVVGARGSASGPAPPRI